MADALARLATSTKTDELNIVTVKVLLQPISSEPEEVELLEVKVT